MAPACYHCGLPVLEPGRYRARICGELRDLCCPGCEAVAGTIAAAGLESYYETRTAPAAPLEPFGREVGDDGAAEAALILDRVRCAACLWLIECRLARVHGVTRAEVNYATQRAYVAWDRGKTGLRAIVDAVRAVGYDAYPYDPQRAAALEQRERRAALWRLFVAGFGAMQVMMYAFPAYVDGGAGTLGADAAQLMRWASLLITAPVLLISCRPFFDGALSELRRRRIGLETPIALGLVGGFAASAWATVLGTGEVYFDSISMLAFLLLAARYAEGAARRRAAHALDPLLGRSPAAARLACGERVVVAPGERVPADGVVEQGASTVDESLLTGESSPVAKRAGDELVGGSVNLEQPLAMRVTRVGADTRAAAIARLVERAAAARPRLILAADRVARVLTYVVLGVAGIAYAVTGNPWVAVAVLVATCPCALGLAAPIVLTRAGAELFRRGALLTRSRALEALGRVSDVVLDKTGTLTTGRASVSRVLVFGELSEARCRVLAATLEASSRHPVARALELAGALPADDAKNHPGEGVEGRVAGRRLRIGSEAFCRPLGASPPSAIEGEGTVVYLADETRWLAAFVLEDRIRPGIAELLESFRGRGLRLHLVSGDRLEAVAGVAARLGIDTFVGGATPRAKLEYVERLQAAGRRVAMIGDGLNDAPVLARADVSFAMSSGADAAQLQADVVILGSQPRAIADSFALARRAMRLVRENLVWALAYNAAVLPLAAAGWIGPWQAALGMGASSLAVLFNALRPLSPDRSWKRSTFSSRSPSPSYS
jgi:Cu2+-exporting ATPase